MKKMNKYQEALNLIEKIFYGMFQGYIDELDVEAIRELVDKATPMKPFLLVAHKKPKKRRYQCPRCGNACLVRYAPFERNENRHCYDCGQAIDWSEE